MHIPVVYSPLQPCVTAVVVSKAGAWCQQVLHVREQHYHRDL